MITIKNLTQYQERYLSLQDLLNSSLELNHENLPVDLESLARAYDYTLALRLQEPGTLLQFIKQKGFSNKILFDLEKTRTSYTEGNGEHRCFFKLFKEGEETAYVISMDILVTQLPYIKIL